MFIFAGIIAALSSYIFNKLVLKRFGDIGIIVVVPFIEETTKTMVSFVLNASIIGTHFIFGFIEGIYDIINSSENIGKWAALASLISHTAFGLATYLAIKTGYSIYWGIFLAWLLHSSWNWYITKQL